MKSFSGKRYLCPILLGVCLTLSACQQPTTPAYDPQCFTCTLSIASVTTGEADFCTAGFQSDNGTVRLTIDTPETLRGVGLTFAGIGTTLQLEEVSIPLSDRVSASLEQLTTLLTTEHQYAMDKKRITDGTVLVFDTGELTLNEAGLPVYVHTRDGREAKVFYPPEVE